MSSETPYILTFHDLLQHASQYDGGRGDGQAEDAYYAAVQLAYREVCMLEEWNCLWTHGRIDLVAPQSSSTITYTHSTRTVTIASGTFPSWSPYAELRIANVNYEVESNPSSTTLILSSRRNPGANVAAGTSYVLFRSAYTLPVGFKKMSEPVHQNWGGMCYVKPSEFLYDEKRLYTTGTPQEFTITGSPDLLGQQVIRFWPTSSEAKTLDYFYIRYPKQLKVSGKASEDQIGTIASSGTAITGTSTAFNALRHNGCILRIGTNSSDVPTGMYGRNPALDERSVTVNSTTSITVDASAQTASGVKYVLSDPVDLAPYLWNLLFRSIEKQLAARTRDKAIINMAQGLYQDAIPTAMESNSQYLLNLADILGARATGRLVDTRGS